ncbi:MAG: LmbE family protein [Frankiales bacterium]|nr:LmbE family protein [Frankiales bacterium]
MTDRPLTLMAVHAHPDDEASTTGGILAKYSAEGIRTVLVTCTNGELGDTPEVQAGETGHGDDHDTEAVVALRMRELADSCKVLGVTHLETLGYHDSGMEGWPQNDAPGSFWSTPVDEAAKPVIALIEKYQPDVVVTYDDYGFYGHPDHIQAHRITLAALDATDSTATVFFPTFQRSKLPEFAARMQAAGMEPPPFDENEFGSPDEDIAAVIDATEFAQQKMDALKAHVSQAGNIFFIHFPMDVFTEAFGREAFVRHFPAWAPGEPQVDDLFAGLR